MSRKESTRRIRIRYLLIGIIIVGEILRFALPFIYNPINALWSDPGRWWEYATTGPHTPPLALIDPIFYQAWLSFVAKLTLDIPLLTAAYAGLMSVITPWLWYRFFRELLPCKNTALAGMAILTWLPSWLGVFSYYMTETLLLPLLGLSLWLSFRAMRKKTSGSFVLAGFTWVLASLTRGIAAPIAAAVTIFAWFAQRQKLSSALSLGLVIALILAPLSYRSYIAGGTLTPLGEPWLNEAYAKSGRSVIEAHYFRNDEKVYYYGFKSPSMGQEPLAPFSDWQSSRTRTKRVMLDMDDLANSWNTAIEHIESQMESPWTLRLENNILLWFGTSWPDNHPDRIIDVLNSIMRFVWLPLFLLAVVLMVRTLLRQPEMKKAALLAALISWFTVQGLMLLAVNEGRYRKPVEGLIIAALLVAWPTRTTTSRQSSMSSDNNDQEPEDAQAIPVRT